MPSMPALCLVVMGPSGVGKTTIARGLSQRLGWHFAEADDFHSSANIAKMSAGIPLNDGDRMPWLRSIRDWISEEAAGHQNSVITCSALKRSYRDVLREAEARVCFVELTGSRELVGERISHRTAHYMPASLLASQYDALEPLQPDEDGILVSVATTPDAIVADAIRQLGLAG